MDDNNENNMEENMEAYIGEPKLEEHVRRFLEIRNPNVLAYYMHRHQVFIELRNQAMAYQPLRTMGILLPGGKISLRFITMMWLLRSVKIGIGMTGVFAIPSMSWAPLSLRRTMILLSHSDNSLVIVL